MAKALPRQHTTAWGAVFGLAMGLVNLRLVAPRWFKDIAALPIGWQLADHLAFGAVFGETLRRQAGDSASSAPNARNSTVALPSANSLALAAMK